ncbi:hypothetical protein PAMA_005606 [Pampus argenteus]
MIQLDPLTAQKHRQTGEDACPLGGVFPSLAGISASVGGSTLSAASSIDSMANIIATYIPSLAGAASTLANPAAATLNSASSISPVPAANAASLDRIVTSLANMPILAGIVSSEANPAVNSRTNPATLTDPPPTGALTSTPNNTKEENPYITVLACWASQDEADTDSSNEEEDTGASYAPSGADGRMEGDPASNSCSNTNKSATIRVSRKKGSNGSSGSLTQSAVFQSSWLDVWKGFSITNVKKQDKGRFSVYFKKKHYDFMAHSDEVQDRWVMALLACRCQPSPTPPDLHGPITIKDPWRHGYAAVWGHDLWIYPSKEGFTLGIASCCVPLNVASVKAAGRQSFTLITPYKRFSLSVDSSKALSVWLDGLSSSISSALSSSQVALRLWENPDNKMCGDCGAANPEWSSVNLLLVICHTCAGQHRALGSNRSKVRSLKMDNKVWTEPLIQLFVAYGNRLANQVWAPAVPAAEQLRPEASDEERSKFIQDKYSRGRYRQVHPLAASRSLMDQVCQSELQSPAPILLAERAGEEEKLHGKLEEDRFLFSLENESAACDVLDLREILSVFIKHGVAHQFKMVTLSDQLICAADDEEVLLSHMTHILKINIGMSLSEIDPSKNTITMVTAHRCLLLRFKEQHSCQCWFDHLQKVLSNQSTAHQSLYPLLDMRSRDLVPPAVQRCISHITQHGMKVEGVYRRCGLAAKVNQLVEALLTSPSSTPLQSDEQGVLDAAAALKQYVRQQEPLFPERDRQEWLQAAVISDERSRFSAYRRLLQQLPDDNRATLSALFGHFYM